MKAATIMFAVAWLSHAVPPAAWAMDLTEVTVGQFRQFVQATGIQTLAEKLGGGQTYEMGWEQRRGWVWHSPYGSPAADNEPAVHVTFDEAQQFCTWAGKRLPSEKEWRLMAYTEQRTQPAAPYKRGQQYPYPTGHNPLGAHCLADCGNQTQAVPHAITSRGKGHAAVASSKAGVNGLYDMGGNVWEWAVSDTHPQGEQQPTMGGSWWYGASPMHANHRATKPRNTAVVYVGFRCI